MAVYLTKKPMPEKVKRRRLSESKTVQPEVIRVVAAGDEPGVAKAAVREEDRVRRVLAEPIARRLQEGKEIPWWLR